MPKDIFGCRRQQRIEQAIDLNAKAIIARKRCETHQVLHIHIGSEWIAAGIGHIAFHVNAGWIDIRNVAMDDDSIMRLQRNVRGSTAGKRLC